MVIGKDGSYFDITGTTGITAMTVDAGRIFTLQFDGAVVLTHSSTLYLAGAANFTTEANDHLTFLAVAANNVRLIGVGLKDGGSPVAAGKILQVVNVTDSTLGTGTTIIPQDGSIPQNTEGDEHMTLAITPTNASNKLLILVTLNTDHSGAIISRTMALFQDSTANALAATGTASDTNNGPTALSLNHYMTAGTTSATTFKIRVGGNASGTSSVNGSNSSIVWTVGATSMTIMEIAV